MWLMGAAPIHPRPRASTPHPKHRVYPGANGRVGLEDNLYLVEGRLARNNAEQMARDLSRG